MSIILHVANIAGKRMSYGFVGTAIEAAHSLGYEFYGVANRSLSSAEEIKEDEEKYGVRLFHVDLNRSPFSFQNIKAYKQLCKIISENEIDYIHCNTPVGGILGRLAGKKCGVKKVIYQAHGFHFYKGAPKKNWLLYYPVEKWLAHYTDALITINQEDYELAKAKLKPRNNGKVYYVPGVGVDTSKYSVDAETYAKKRNELGISLDAFVIISVGELNANKNNSVIISAMEKLQNKKIHYILCGVGEKKAELQAMAEAAGLQNNIHFLGYRNDVNELYQAADCFVMPSFREGLSRSIMEAMASGLPCIVSKIRGNTDLIVDKKGGYLLEPKDISGFANAIESIIDNPKLLQKMRKFNLETIKNFDVSQVCKKIKEIYSSIIS